jgi:hypothetical protein
MDVSRNLHKSLYRIHCIQGHIDRIQGRHDGRLERVILLALQAGKSLTSGRQSLAHEKLVVLILELDEFLGSTGESTVRRLLAGDLKGLYISNVQSE